MEIKNVVMFILVALALLSTTAFAFTVYVYNSSNNWVSNAMVYMYRTNGELYDSATADEYGQATFRSEEFPPNEEKVYFVATKNDKTYESIDGRTAVTFAYEDRLGSQTTCQYRNGAWLSCNVDSYALSREITSASTPETVSVRVITSETSPAGVTSPSTTGVRVYVRDSLNGQLITSGVTTTSGVTFSLPVNKDFYLTTASATGAATGGDFGYLQELSGGGVPSYKIVKSGSTYNLCRVSDNSCTSTLVMILYRLRNAPTATPAPSTTANYYVWTWDNNQPTDAVVAKYKVEPSNNYRATLLERGRANNPVGTAKMTIDGGEIVAFMSFATGVTPPSIIDDIRNYPERNYVGIWTYNGRVENNIAVACSYTLGCSSTSQGEGQNIIKSLAAGPTYPSTDNQAFQIYVYEGSNRRLPYATVYMYQPDGVLVTTLTANADGIASVEGSRMSNNVEYYFKAFKNGVWYNTGASATNDKYIVVYDTGTTEKGFCKKTNGVDSGCGGVMTLWPIAAAATPQPALQCADSDGNDIYTRGTTVGLDYYGINTITVVDGCTNSYGGAETPTGSYVVENTCQASGKTVASYYRCPTGYSCDSGRCVYSSTTPTSATPSNQTTTTGYTIKVNVGVNDYPVYQDWSRVQLVDGYVNIYKVTPVSSGNYNGYLIETKKSPRGEGAYFTIEPGQVVDFVSFTSRDKARAATEWKFTSPPYKNFGDSAERICQINFLDSNSKMVLSDGSYSCSESFSYPYSDSTPINESPTSVAVENTYTLGLQKGWNMLSLPYESAKLIENTCSASVAYFYDSSSNSYKKFELDAGQMTYNSGGFWVKAKEPCKIVFGSLPIPIYSESFSKQLNVGWNLVGAPYNGVNFNEISGSCTIKSGPWSYNPSSGRWQKAERLKEGEGYFVKVSEACVLGGGSPPQPPSG